VLKAQEYKCVSKQFQKLAKIDKNSQKRAEICKKLRKIRKNARFFSKNSAPLEIEPKMKVKKSRANLKIFYKILRVIGD